MTSIYLFCSNYLRLSYCRHFGDVKSISVEDPVEPGSPQYALVTFGSRDTMLSVLGGKDTAKFQS
jgi:hypothetical protein